MSCRKEKIVFLVGPTAVGKTAVGLSLASLLKTDIISCDAMQVYRGMDILSSKPTATQRRKVKHHLIDCVDPEKTYNAAAYRRAALPLIRRMHRAGDVPLFVGGTGLYMAVLVEGIFSIKVASKRIRRELEEECRAAGSQSLHRRLQQIDPEAARKIHPHDAKRIIRALEVFAATGKRISELQKERKGLWDKYDIRIYCLDRPRQELYERINRRVETMFRTGLVKEVKGLVREKLSPTAAYAIGIREVQDYLCGRASLAQAKERMQHNTRLYAKRQLTWFRKDPRICWIPWGQETPREIAAVIAKRIQQPPMEAS